MKRSAPALAILALCLAACGRSEPPAAESRDSADGLLRLARVTYRDTLELQHLADHYDAAEQVDRDARTITLLLDDRAYRELLAAGYRIDIDEAETARINSPRVRAPGQTRGIAGYECYRTVEETDAALQSLAAARPDLVEIRAAGSSWVDARGPGATPFGYTINVAKLTNRSIPGPKPVFFLHAAIHAREYTTAETAMRFAEHLVAGHGTDPDATWILDHHEVHVMPMANPDARKYAEAQFYWRKNVNAEHCPTGADPAVGAWSGQGVDLNRNSSFMWGELNEGGSSGFDCDQTYRGTGPASEPETQAVETYASRIFRDQRGPGIGEAAPEDAEGVFISLHNFAGLVLFPWSFTDAVDAPNYTALERLGLKFGYFNHYTVCSDCLYLANGVTDDFTYGEFGVASYTFELGTQGFFEDCATFESQTWPDNLPALLYAAKVARRPYQLAFGPDVLNVSATPATAAAGVPVLLAATADGTRYENGGRFAQPTKEIVAARYSIGSAPWEQGTVHTMTLSGIDESRKDLRAVIDTANLAPGRHLVFVEAQEADGHWGTASAVFLEIAN